MQNDMMKETPRGGDREFITKRDVAQLLGCSVRTVENLMAKGRLPVLRLSARLVRFPRTAILATLNAATDGGK